MNMVFQNKQTDFSKYIKTRELVVNEQKPKQVAPRQLSFKSSMLDRIGVRQLSGGCGCGK